MTDDYDYTSDEEEDVKPKLDKETKDFIEEIEEKEEGVNRNGFSEYFNYELSRLVSKSLNRNTQDLKKNLGKIKQQKIKLDTDERNSTNNKNDIDRLNMILSVIDGIYQFFEYTFLLDKQSDQQQKINESTTSEDQQQQPDQQPDQQQQNQNLRSWVMLMDDYTKLKKMLINTKKEVYI